MWTNHNQMHRLLLCGNLSDSSLTLLSVSVHCHQRRKWIREDRECPPHRSASDFLGKGMGQPDSVSWLEAPAEPTVYSTADGGTIFFFFFLKSGTT